MSDVGRSSLACRLRRWGRHGGAAAVLSIAWVSAHAIDRTAPPAAAAPIDCPVAAPGPADTRRAEAGVRDRGLLWRLEKDGRV